MYFLSSLLQKEKPHKTHSPFRVSVLIAGLNEEDVIERRIDDIFSGNFPSEDIQVIVISDGSTDNTVLAAEKAKEKWKNVVVVENSEKSGRAIAHNKGVKAATGDILVFTDAGTIFCENFLNNITIAFNNPEVGFTTGALRYKSNANSNIYKSASIYWKFEQKLRQWESNLGLNVFGSGACCAMRRVLYKPIPSTGDVDFTSPLDVALQGYKCLHIPKAVAYDEMPESVEDELKARIRMTSKNFHGTLSRWGVTGFLQHPLLTIVILSHKYGRWITPFLLLITFVSSLLLYIEKEETFFGVLLLIQLIFYFLGIVGKFKPNYIPGSSSIYSFLLSNYGMMMGIFKALSGQVVSSYTPIKNKTIQ